MRDDNKQQQQQQHKQTLRAMDTVNECADCGDVGYTCTAQCPRTLKLFSSALRFENERSGRERRAFLIACLCDANMIPSAVAMDVWTYLKPSYATPVKQKIKKKTVSELDKWLKMKRLRMTKSFAFIR